MLHPLLQEQINESLATHDCSTDASYLFKLISQAYHRFEEQLNNTQQQYGHTSYGAYGAKMYANEHNHRIV
jgi:hypothetical protein